MRRAFLLAALSIGCASQTGFGRATTLRPGESEIGVGIEATAILVNTRRERPVPVPWLDLAAGYHRGVGERLELGGRAWGLAVERVGFSSFGGAFDAKYQLFRDRGRWDASVAGALAYHQTRLGTPWHYATATVPLLFGYDFGESQLVFGPRLGLTLWMGEGQNPIELPLLGTSVAYAWRISKRFQLVPELVLLYTPVSFDGETQDADRYGATTVQLGVGCVFDL